jgi:lipid-A-disaccharide synthase-like uncharacterized protein
MTLKMEMLGWVGTALVIVAYVPQIHHLYFEECAWGISISTWVIWLVAGALLLSYCIFRSDTLFAIVQVVNITASVTTIVLALRSDRICPYHRSAVKVARTTKNNESIRLQKEHYAAKTNEV